MIPKVIFVRFTSPLEQEAHPLDMDVPRVAPLLATGWTLQKETLCPSGFFACLIIPHNQG